MKKSSFHIQNAMLSGKPKIFDPNMRNIKVKGDLFDVKGRIGLEDPPLS
jgi:hypothetical protein